MDSFATPAELGERLGQTLAGVDETRAQAILDDVSAEVRDIAGEQDTWTDPDDGTILDTLPALVKTVVLRAAKREWFNRGFASESIGDYSYRERSADEPSLSRKEERQIRRAAGAPAFGSIPLEGTHISDVLYVPTTPGEAGDWIPWENIYP